MMMRRLKPALVVAVVSVLLGAAACSSQPVSSEPETVTISGSYPGYASVKQLWSTADLVIEGTVQPGGRVIVIMPVAGDGTDPQADPGGSLDGLTEEEAGLVYTVRTVLVSRVLKGKASAGQQIEVKEMGGTRNGVRYVEEGATPLTEKSRVLLFLQTYPDSAASLLNPQQARFDLDGAGGYRSLPGNALRATPADLDALRAGRAG
ncbi:hypothetical protein [Catellatospora chokoriensis]|uniref:Lipoprotein n=1 Tax=Catellatospora chokoriensis TaxID=310353 RepID=A0A8J3K1F2_9ACTN|nr:hypothetical protein [Catellatospora chokoriensis]GIF91186.1 hypothetical protein Cch02nite_46300 [Catellatospora chokoriensis]